MPILELLNQQRSGRLCSPAHLFNAKMVLANRNVDKADTLQTNLTIDVSTINASNILNHFA